jgi:chitinase
MLPSLRPVTTYLLLTFWGSSALAQSPALIGYWHNWNDFSAPYVELDQVDPRYNVIEVAFAEPAPGTTYNMQFAPSITAPNIFTAQVAAHQDAGHKVILSIGGANATVQLNSDGERDQFVTSMMGILNTYGFDGIDLDLEGASVSVSGGTIAAPVDARIVRLIDAVNAIADQFEAANGHAMMLTMAPETAFVQGGQSAFGGIWGAYLPVIHALRDRLDILQVQLYNSGSMYGIDGNIYAQGTADFIVSQTEAVIQGFTTGGGLFEGLPPEKVAVALPACTNAAGGGYTDTATVRSAMEYLLGQGPQPGSYTLAQAGGYPTLRGMMTWSINWDAVSACDGAYSYAENYERIFGDISTGADAMVAEPVSLFPNPVTADIFFTAPTNGPITIRDLTGRIVQHVSARIPVQEVDVRALTAGIYVIEGAELAPRRFMKD